LRQKQIFYAKLWLVYTATPSGFSFYTEKLRRLFIRGMQTGIVASGEEVHQWPMMILHLSKLI